MKTNKRNSSIEILRLILIFLIVLMHTDGGKEVPVTVFVNVLGNMGVTCFILISGYYGIKLDIKKIIKIDIMVIFYSLLSFFISTYLNGDFNKKELLRSLLPIISNKYWFISCYVFLCLLSPFLNDIFNCLNRKRISEFIVTLIVLFVLIPTIFGFDLMGKGGKDLMHFIIIYLIGRYIKIYIDGLFNNRRKAINILIYTCILNFALNMVVYLVLKNVNNYFARDNSFLIMIQAISLFTIFKQSYFYSEKLNRFASNILSIYILEGIVKQIIRYNWDYVYYQYTSFYLLITVLIAVLTIIAAVCINETRKFLFDNIDDKIANNIIKIMANIHKKIIKGLEKTSLCGNK